MALRWTMEALWAAIAVTSSVLGGLYTSVYHSGASAQQILSLQQQQQQEQQQQHAIEKHIEKHDEQLGTIQQQNAAMAQQLRDIADTVHDMHENGVKRK